MSKRKRFNKELYKKYDQLAKKYFKKILPAEYVALGPKRRTAVDLEVYHDSCDNLDKDEAAWYAEVEVKVVWRGVEFPYPTIHLPQRKEKYCLLDRPCLFNIFNKDGSKCAHFWSFDVLSSPLIEVPNKYVYSGEYFFNIPLTRVSFDIEEAIKKGYDATS